jgi:spore maturation protein CgeB
MDRVIFLYECRYRNDGPPLYLKTNFDWHKDELAISEVKHYVPEGDYRRWGKADLYVWVDHGEDALAVEPFNCPRPNVYWCSDSHLGMDYRLKKAEEFDYVFLSISRHIEKFKNHLGHDRVYWLPHAGEPTCYKHIPSVKKYDTCFIGHLPNEERIDLLDSLFSEFPEFYYGQKFFEAANEKYNESKLVFNHCIGKEANMRLFEGTLSGSAVLCSESEDIRFLGYDESNIIFYKGKNDLKEKARYYLSHEEEREAIAKAGMEHTLANHTYLHRAKKILEVINGNT